MDELVVIDSTISINDVTLYIFNGIITDFCDITTIIRACDTSLTFEELLSKCPSLYCDNTGVTQLSLNHVMHSRIKHIVIDLHFVHDLVSKGVLEVSHVSTHDQLTDFLTKPLPHVKFQTIVNKIDLTTSMRILRERIKDDL